MSCEPHMNKDLSLLNHKLEWAISRGDIIECRQLMAAGAGNPSDMPSSKQASCLKAAITSRKGANELLDLLLAAKFDPNSVYGENNQSTAVTHAAKKGRLDLLEKLVAAGADIHWKSPTGMNAASEALPSLSLQAEQPDTLEFAEVRQWLSQRGVVIDPLCSDSRWKLIGAASNPCSWPDVPKLLSLGMDPAVLKWTPFMMKLTMGDANIEDVQSMPEDEIGHRDGDDRTPFLMAVEAGRLDIANALLKRGSDLHSRGRCGATALHIAARYGHCHLAEWLVSLGLSVDIEDEQHHTALRHAVSFGKLEATQLLLKHGANVLASDEIGYRAIHDAWSREVIELLLNSGAEVNDVSGGGSWPLKDACEVGDASLVRFLLERGADPNLTSTGETALFRAASSGSIECASLLLDAGADINATDVDYWTCLWCVDSLAMAQFLLDRGADPTMASEDFCPLAVSALYREARLKKESLSL